MVDEPLVHRGCLFLLLMMLSPRLGIVFLWAFTDYVQRWFTTWVWPLLGLVFLPWTTLMYVLVTVPVGGITWWGWLFVALGHLSDIGSHVNTYANRNQAQSMHQQQFGYVIGPPNKRANQWNQSERSVEATPQSAVGK